MREYYRCGGDMLAEKAKMMTVRGILPPDTPSSLHLALRGVSSYENFKRVLRLTLQFLSDHGGVSGRNRSANVMDEAPEAESRNGIAVGRGVAVGRDQEAIEAGDSGEGVMEASRLAGWISDFHGAVAYSPSCCLGSCTGTESDFRWPPSHPSTTGDASSEPCASFW